MHGAEQERRNVERRGDVMQTMERLEEKIDRMMAAFPGDDPDGHRRYHEAVIRRAEARAAFWEKLTYELVKWGLTGALGWLAVVSWQAFLRGPK